jgi:hypothetical protein
MIGIERMKLSFRTFKYYWLGLFLTLFTSSNLKAHFGFGNLVMNVHDYQVDRHAHRSFFSFGPYFSFHYNFKIPQYHHEFIPELGLALYAKPSPNHSRRTFFFLYPLSWEFKENHWLRYGLANFLTGVAGPGGTTVLENGSSYNEYYKPYSIHYSHNGAVFLGYEYRIKEEKYSFRADLYSVSFLSVNRSLAYSLSFNMYFL